MVFNNPRTEDGKIRRWVHNPMSFEKFGTNVQIHENGKVTINKVAGKNPTSGELEYDEIEVPASLIFDIAQALKLTRKETFVNIEKSEETI